MAGVENASVSSITDIVENNTEDQKIPQDSNDWVSLQEVGNGGVSRSKDQIRNDRAGS